MKLLLALLLSSTLLAGAAFAQVDTARQIGAQRFAPSKTVEGIIDTEAPQVASSGGMDAALWLHYAKNPLVLYERSDTGDRRAGPLVEHRLDGNLVLAVAFFDRLELGVDLAVVLYQARPETLELGGQSAALGPLSSAGMSDLRLQPKLQLLKAEDFGLDLAILLQAAFPVGGKKEFLGDTGFTLSPVLVLGRIFSQGTRLALNLGYLLRPGRESLGLSVDDQLLLRAGLGHRLDARGGPPLELDLDFSGAIDAKEPFQRVTQSPAELLASVAYDFVPGASLFVGGGVGLAKGYATPDYRLFGGLRLAFRERDRDHDGVEDELDACIDTPEDPDGFEDQDGCPDLDNDDDQIPDLGDQCPDEAEDRDGFEDQNGCPDPDNDQDGSLDIEDRCPLEAGPPENRGCPDLDRDQDGLIDRLDRCPEQAEDRDDFEDEDGCPDPDNDQDGILDRADLCPIEAGPLENRGCPDLDRDGDTVVDRLDNCPDEPGPPSNKGCKQKQLVEITATKIAIYDKVFFETGKTRILPRSFPLLDNVAQVLRAHSEVDRVIVEGHTDDRGSDALNLKLSQGRAESVRKFLIEAGVAADRLEAIGFGETRPLGSNRTEAGRSTNRRVEFTIPEKRSVQ